MEPPTTVLPPHQLEGPGVSTPAHQATKKKMAKNCICSYFAKNVFFGRTYPACNLVLLERCSAPVQHRPPWAGGSRKSPEDPLGSGCYSSGPGHLSLQGLGRLPKVQKESSRAGRRLQRRLLLHSTDIQGWELPPAIRTHPANPPLPVGSSPDPLSIPLTSTVIFFTYYAAR